MLTNFRLLLVFQNRSAQLRSQGCAENSDKELASGNAAQESARRHSSLLLAVAILFLLHQCGHRQSLGSPFFLDFALDDFLLLDSHLGLLAPHFALIRWQGGRVLRVTADGARHVAGVWAG